MKDKLENLLVAVNEIESKTEGELFLLEILKEHFEYKNQMESFYLVQIIDEWMKNEFEELQGISTELDRIIMYMKES